MRCHSKMSVEDRAFWMAVRQALLMALDALERRLGISPRTSELRRDRRADKPLAIYAESETMVVQGN